MCMRKKDLGRDLVCMRKKDLEVSHCKKWLKKELIYIVLSSPNIYLKTEEY